MGDLEGGGRRDRLNGIKRPRSHTQRGHVTLEAGADCKRGAFCTHTRLKERAEEEEEEGREGDAAAAQSGSNHHNFRVWTTVADSLLLWPGSPFSSFPLLVATRVDSSVCSVYTCGTKQPSACSYVLGDRTRSL